MMCRLPSVPNLLQNRAPKDQDLGTLSNNPEIPPTFLRSSRMYVDEIKQTGRRVIAVVQNLTNRRVLIFLRYIYSVNGLI